MDLEYEYVDSSESYNVLLILAGEIVNELHCSGLYTVYISIITNHNDWPDDIKEKHFGINS